MVHLDDVTFHRGGSLTPFVKYTEKSERTFFLLEGYYAYCVQALWGKLEKLMSWIISHNGSWHDNYASLVQHGDTIIGFSFARYTVGRQPNQRPGLQTAHRASALSSLCGSPPRLKHDISAHIHTNKRRLTLPLPWQGVSLPQLARDLWEMRPRPPCESNGLSSAHTSEHVTAVWVENLNARYKQEEVNHTFI